LLAEPQRNGFDDVGAVGHRASQQGSASKGRATSIKGQVTQFVWKRGRPDLWIVVLSSVSGW
jgi:hypothetical protein